MVETVELEMEEGGVLNGERGTVESVGGEVVGGGKGAGGIPKGGEREEEEDGSGEGEDEDDEEDEDEDEDEDDDDVELVLLL